MKASEAIRDVVQSAYCTKLRRAVTPEQARDAYFQTPPDQRSGPWDFLCTDRNCRELVPTPKIKAVAYRMTYAGMPSAYIVDGEPEAARSPYYAILRPHEHAARCAMRLSMMLTDKVKTAHEQTSKIDRKKDIARLKLAFFDVHAGRGNYGQQTPDQQSQDKPISRSPAAGHITVQTVEQFINGYWLAFTPLEREQVRLKAFGNRTLASMVVPAMQAKAGQIMCFRARAKWFANGRDVRLEEASTDYFSGDIQRLPVSFYLRNFFDAKLCPIAHQTIIRLTDGDAVDCFAIGRLIPTMLAGSVEVNGLQILDTHRQFFAVQPDRSSSNAHES